MARKIIHVDMDCFYASIEVRDNQKLAGKPVVIARDPRHSGGKGVVSTANYVARSFGVHSAMNANEALNLCPDAVFVPPDFKKYRRVSKEIHEIFHEYTDKIEPIAFDEAYLDVTECKLGLKSATIIAHRIQQEIFEKTGLTCSTGISYNKFLAKLASDYAKPVGMTLVREDEALDFLLPLKIEKFRGVGRKTVNKMHELGVYNGYDLYGLSELDLIHYFGKMGHFFYEQVRGIDDREVEWQRERKSFGVERTFNMPLVSNEEIDAQLKWTAQKLADDLTRAQKHGKTLVVKVRNSEFETKTKRLTLADYFQNDATTIAYYGRQLLDELYFEGESIRLMGLSMTSIDSIEYENIALDLFGRNDVHND